MLAHEVDEFLNWITRDGKPIHYVVAVTGVPDFRQSGERIDLNEIERLAASWLALKGITPHDHNDFILAVNALYKLRGLQRWPQ